MTRGVLWLTWRNPPGLARSRTSVKHWHPELPQHVVELPGDSTVLSKSRMFIASPFEETLFLDADTTVLGRLDYGFDKARQHGLALTHSANPWQRRYYNLQSEPDAVEYSSGVMFFGEDMAELFFAWGQMKDDSRCKYQADDGVVHEQRFNDQALLTKAIHDNGFNPFVLPQNWNFVPRWQKQFFGALKIVHGTDDIPSSLLKWNEEQSKPDAVIRCTQLP